MIVELKAHVRYLILTYVRFRARFTFVKLTASKLRQDIYRILDRVLETGRPVQIERRGKKLEIVPVEPKGRLESLEARPYLKTDPEELVHLDWSGEWRP